MILSAVFNKGYIDSISLHPVLIDNFQPALASDTLFTAILDLMKTISPSAVQFKILEDRMLFLNGNNGCAFSVPMLRASTIQKEISIYRDRILIEDNLGATACSYLIKNGIIDDAKILAGPEPEILAIIRSENADHADKIGHYQLKDDGVHEISFEHTEDQPWKIEKGDFDGNSKPELCLAVNKMAKFSKTRTNRIQVFAYSNQRLEPLWFSSVNEIDFTDMAIRDIQNDGLADLVVLRKKGTNTELLLYQWIGSRFILDHVLMSDLQCNNIEDALFHYSNTK
jgi:hypothetical protein